MAGIEALRHPEVIVGLVGPAGTDLRVVIRCISAEFTAIGYAICEVRLSTLLHSFTQFGHLAEITHDEAARIDAHMDAADDLRQRTDCADIMALLSVARIRKERRDNASEHAPPASRVVYLLNSLKHPEEIETLRKIYGDLFLTVSVYAPRADRVARLAERIAQSKSNSNGDRYRADAERLVEKDANAGRSGTGQNVRDAFPKGDLFLRWGAEAAMRAELRRFVELIFGHPFHTPRRDEYSMFIAQAAALRSADLSRQVGAAILSDGGSILGVGCNDVPKAGGGVVWSGDTDDFRDFVIGYDASAKKKREIVREIFSNLRQANWIAETLNDRTVDQLVDEALETGTNPPLRDARVSSIIEFGRIVHAEMNAILDAMSKGQSATGSTLYCTTFPCHMCARHIVGAGIRKVVYIEPYPKSLARDLYRNEICVEDDGDRPNIVRFEAFVGVAPRQYMQLFAMPHRKTRSGDSVEWQATSATYRYRVLNRAYLDNESAVGNHVKTVLAATGLEM
ncbi:anti-phage dCTP deaminase [Reyranella sp. CPCC 100927]|uniref:anti-phage dCTP deaminase n=1 Tax=Reyranella sp. CPCC 100927 TaxID=2599616 RepID=UPI0011B84C5F|nr:anti-phage dCTP deaminase [Reyranella sp. CPCC 100927]TWT14954.1 hypothetical protein FQU96_00880 [Reyranella sp. CPCC 100927]